MVLLRSPPPIDALAFCCLLPERMKMRGKKKKENQSESNEREGNPDEKNGPKKSCHDTHHLHIIAPSCRHALILPLGGLSIT